MKIEKRIIELSIILPVFNEERNIPIIVEKYLPISKKAEIEVLFVEDGGSSDKTRDEIEKFQRKYGFIKSVFTNERGYGISIYNGLIRARGEYVCWTHADLQADPKDTLEALELIKKQKNPRICYVKGKRYGRPLFDSFFTFGMSLFETLYLRQRLYDINAQPNLFHKSFLSLMKNPPKDFSFDIYSYFIAKKNNYRVIRFPVYFGKRTFGESSWNSGLRARFKFIKRTLDFTFKLKSKNFL